MIGSPVALSTGATRHRIRPIEQREAIEVVVDGSTTTCSSGVYLSEIVTTTA